MIVAKAKVNRTYSFVDFVVGEDYFFFCYVLLANCFSFHFATSYGFPKNEERLSNT